MNYSKGGLISGIILFGIIVLFYSCNQTTHKGKSNTNPHIVLIVADDLGFGDLSCYGASKINTPAIDHLATNGIKFNRSYVSSSMCSPSRYSILTGRYSWRTRLEYGVLKYFDRPLIEEDRTTIASLLKRNGYYTACIGKWHLGMDWTVNENAPENPEESVFNSWAPNTYEYIDYAKPIKNGPTQRGFDYFYGITGSNNMQPYVFIENDRVTQAPSIKQKPYDHYVNALRAPNWDIKTVNIDLTNKAVEVINNHFNSKRAQPLFLYFPASAPHRPCLPTFTKDQSEAGLRGDVVEELDWSVNEIVQALMENGVFENTILLFTSDNGPRAGDPVFWLEQYEEGDYEDWQPKIAKNFTPELINKNGNKIWKKGWMTYDHKASGDLLGFKSDSWEGGFRVPFVISWPEKIKESYENSNLICLSDLLATFAEIVGDSLQMDEGVDSYSFLSNITYNQAPQVRESMVLTGGASGAMVAIKDNWKYIEAAKKGRWNETFYPNGPSTYDFQLYDLENDIHEQNNVFDSFPDKVAELRELIMKVKSEKKFEGKN
jgi:arylsulfatase A-like enzyme